MKTQPILGKQIDDIDISKPLYTQQKKLIEEALYTHKVIVFKNQKLNDQTQKNFLFNFGEPFVMNHDTPTLGSDSTNDCLIVVGNQASEYKNPYLGFQEVLPHSDHQWLEKPSSVSALHAIKIEENSSPTIWYDMQTAYELLDEKIKVEIQNIKIITYNPFYRPFGSVSSKYVKREFDIPPGEINPHPLVRTHPVTGKKILYMNLAYEIEFENMDYSNGIELYKTLQNHINSLTNIYTHNWEVGDVVVWDNRATIHYRPHFNEKIKRVLKRVSLSGEKPY